MRGEDREGGEAGGTDDDGDNEWEELIRELRGFGSVEGGFDRTTDQRLYLEMRRQVIA